MNFYNPDGRVKFADGRPMTRKLLLEYFVSDEFLSQHKNKTASEIGHEVRLSTLWDEAGATCFRTKTDLEIMKKRGANPAIVTINPRTETGKKQLEELREKEAAKKEADAKAARMQRIAAMTPADIKKLMAVNPEWLEGEAKKQLMQFQADYLELKAAVDAAKKAETDAKKAAK